MPIDLPPNGMGETTDAQRAALYYARKRRLRRIEGDGGRPDQLQVSFIGSAAMLVSLTVGVHLDAIFSAGAQFNVSLTNTHYLDAHMQGGAEMEVDVDFGNTMAAHFEGGASVAADLTVTNLLVAHMNAGAEMEAIFTNADVHSLQAHMLGSADMGVALAITNLLQSHMQGSAEMQAQLDAYWQLAAAFSGSAEMDVDLETFFNLASQFEGSAEMQAVLTQTWLLVAAMTAGTSMSAQLEAAWLLQADYDGSAEMQAALTALFELQAAFVAGASMSVALSAVSDLVISGTPQDRVLDNQAYGGFTPGVTGGAAPYAFTLVGDPLPTGLSMSGSTGAITGTPTVPGTYDDIVIRVTDDNGDTDDLGPFTITVGEELTITGTPFAKGVNTEAYAGFTPGGGGGFAPLTYTLSTGTLPTGMSLNSSTGAITGTPTQTTAASNLRITVTDDEGNTAILGPFTITINANLTISGSPGAATRTVSYTFTPTVGGGWTPRSFALTTGTLPTGLSLNSSTGAITGTPTTVVTQSNLRITVTDDIGTERVLGPFSIAVAGVSSISFISASHATTAGITCPSVNPGDILVYIDRAENVSGAVSAVTPSGFTNVHDGGGTPVRSRINAKICTGSEDGSTLTGMNGNSKNAKVLLLFRPNIVPLTMTASGAGGQISASGVSHVVDVVSGTQGTWPRILAALYGATGAVTGARTMSPAKDGEQATSNGVYGAYKIFAPSGSSNTTVSMTDQGDQNTVAGVCLRFN